MSLSTVVFLLWVLCASLAIRAWKIDGVASTFITLCVVVLGLAYIILVLFEHIGFLTWTLPLRRRP